MVIVTYETNSKILNKGVNLIDKNLKKIIVKYFPE